MLSLDKSESNFIREGVLTCIRKDKESNFSFSEREILLKLISEVSGGKVKHSDTHINKDRLSWAERMNELEQVWDEFKKAEIIVTDRLHGMIFAAITKTPSLVLLNNNHKIIQTYNDWLFDCEYIILVSNVSDDEIVKNIKVLKSLNVNNISMLNLAAKFNNLRNELLIS